jgi:hypothetical protein
MGDDLYGTHVDKCDHEVIERKQLTKSYQDGLKNPKNGLKQAK